MHQYSFMDLFERMAIYAAGPFPWRNQGNRYFQIAIDYFTKWPEAYAINNQEASTVAEALVTVCRFGVPWELQSYQGHNFKSHMTKEVLQNSGVSKMHNTPLHRSRKA
jgi:hypothetical protein